MPRLAAHESRKPDLVQEERIGEQEARSPRAPAPAVRRSVARASRPASATTAIAIARSTDGSQRVMVPKHTSTAHRGDHPPAQAEATQHRREQREHERDVLARDRGEVREARGPELLGERVGDAAGVAEQEAGEERALGRAPGARIRRAPARAVRWRAGRAEPERAPTPTSSVACNSPTACFHRQRTSKPSSGCNQPRSTTDSPADSNRRWPATSPDAVDQHPRPPSSRPSTTRHDEHPRSKRAASGSSTSVATTRSVGTLGRSRR